MAALVQLEHGCRLSHRTFLFLHVTQDLGFGCGADEDPVVLVGPVVGGESVSCRLFEVLVAGPLPLLEVDGGIGGDVVVSAGLMEKSA